MMENEQLTQTITGSAFKVHNTLGVGFLEKVYENALCIELAKQGLHISQQSPVTVYYEGEPVGEYFADILVENKVIIELKAVRELHGEHEVQLVNYLTATGINVGLLINFGPSVQVKHKFRQYKANNH
ncbi:MAG: GxxExxY protein [Anaerolineae bacterium]